jgi:hypothetical protein
MSNDDMVDYFDRLEKQSKALREEALRFSWYMMGGLNYEDAMLLSNTDRELISKIIKDNLETSKKSGMPFF